MSLAGSLKRNSLLEAGLKLPGNLGMEGRETRERRRSGSLLTVGGDWFSSCSERLVSR